MEHEHITFYSNSARGKAALLGGEELIIGSIISRCGSVRYSEQQLPTKL